MGILWRIQHTNTIQIEYIKSHQLFIDTLIIYAQVVYSHYMHTRYMHITSLNSYSK